MLTCVLEIGLLIAGIYVLITGRIKLSSKRATTGVAARIAGLVMILPLPLALAVGFVIGLQKASQGAPLNFGELQLKIALVEVCIVVGCVLLGFSIALIASRPCEDAEPRRRIKPKSQVGEHGGTVVAPMEGAPVSAEESIPYAEVVEEATTGLTQQPSPIPKGPRTSPQGPTRRPPVRVQSVKASGSHVIWWVLGGVAACFFCCAIPAGGFLAWWFLGPSSAQPTTPQQAVRGRPLIEADNAPPGQKQEWGDQMQKFPQFDGPPGGGGLLPPGQFQPPGRMQPPEPEFKPIVIPQPAAPHLNIRPPALPGERVVRPLPSAIGDAAVGGGGRFLVLYLPRDRKLAIFDVNVAKVVNYLSFADDIKFAAGMDKLLVALPDKNILQRWSLTTFERELSVPLAGEGQVESLTMGSASNGPLLIRRGQQGPGVSPALTFFDIRTMKPLEAKWGNNNGGPLDGRAIRASANGKVFGLVGWGPVTLVWDDGRIAIHHRQQGGGIYALPSPDGQAVFTDDAIYTESFKPAAGAANVRGAMPATHGRYYMAGNSIYLLGDSRPLMTVPADNAELNPGDPRDLRRMMIGNEALALDKRGYFIPDAKLLIHIPLSNDQLVLRRLDVEAGLEKSGIDYLFVASQAPAKAKKGAIYSYQLMVKSKKGGVKYRVESGPKGMRISNTGRVTWRVPHSVAESEIDVILTISDRSGQEVFHSFRIHPGDRGEEQAAPLANLAAVPDNPADKRPDPVQVAEPEPPQPAERPILPPLRSAPIIRPPRLAADKVVRQLPSEIADVAVGGGGRYLILHLRQERKLAVFDINTAKISGYIPVAGGNVKIAAGREKLLVALGGDNLIQRWDLATLRREVTAPLPVQFKLSLIAMGSNSDGPLLVGSADGVWRPEMFFMDIMTLKKLPIEKTGPTHIHIMEGDGVRASADGRLFGLWANHMGFQTLILEGKEARGYNVPGASCHVLPGPDGKVIYTGQGRFTNQARPLGDHSRGAPYCLPAVQGDFYLTVKADAPRGRDKSVRGTLAVHLAGDARPLTTLSEMDLPARIHTQGFNSQTLPADKHIHFIPAANLIVTIPATSDRLELHRFNVMQAVEKSGIDYLFVISHPPVKAKRGATYRYQLAVKSKKGGVKYRVESGPNGMKISGAGLLTWDVPRAISTSPINVIPTIGDGSGREIFHTFSILPGNEGEEQIAVVDVPPPDKEDEKRVEPEPVKPPQKPPEPIVEKTLLPQLRSVPAIRPPRLAADKVVKTLSSAMTDVAVGGGGRYLILHLPKERKLAIFDVSEAKVTGYVPLPADNIRFTAGRDKLFVALADKNVLQRWSLADLQREAMVPVPTKDEIHEILIGSASDGPLLIATSSPRPTGAGMIFVDIKTLKVIPLRLDETSTFPFEEQDRIRVSANGRVFTRWKSKTVPQGLWAFVLQNREVHGYYAGLTLGHLAPDPEGKVIYSAGGRYTNQTKSLSDRRNGPLYCLPATEPAFFLSVEGDFVTWRSKKPQGSLAVHLAGDERPLIRLPQIEAPCKIDITVCERLNGDKRIYFIPSAKLIVTLPDTNDRVVLHRFDIEQALAKSDIDYLFVASHPPLRAKRGATYRYQLAVKSKKGGVKYRVESGPEGMKLSPPGLLTWDVPRSISESQVDVILTISDQSGQEIFHTFHITPGDQGEEQSPAAADVPSVPVKSNEIKAEPAPKPAQPSPSSGLGIKPPPLSKDRVEVPLPSEVTDLAVGGAGRYLALYLREQRKLALFDVNMARVVRWLPADDGEVRFAAGREKLLLALGGQKVLQRWDLATGRREAVAPLPVREPIFALSMGSTSAGPLLIAAKESTTLVDARTLKPIDMSVEVPGVGRGKMLAIGSKWVRASADGQVFTFRTDVGGEPHTMYGLTLRGGRASLHSVWGAPGSILAPSPDGRIMYSARGVLTSQLARIAPAGTANARKAFVPAEHGGYYLMLEPGEDKSEPRLTRRRPPTGVTGGIGAVSFFIPGQEKPLARLDGVEGVYRENIAYGQSSDPLPYDRRLHYLPDAHLLVSIPTGEDRLVLRRFNIEEALEKSGVDYLLVTSLPPLETKKGGIFTYRPLVKSKKGGVQARLDSGPPGMKLSPDGVLTWLVPADFAEAEVEVLLNISDKSGQEVFHRFRIVPSDR